LRLLIGELWVVGLEGEEEDYVEGAWRDGEAE